MKECLVNNLGIRANRLKNMVEEYDGSNISVNSGRARPGHDNDIDLSSSMSVINGKLTNC